MDIRGGVGPGARAVFTMAMLFACTFSAALAQTVDGRVQAFAAAWGQAHLASADTLFADAVRLTLDGRTHVGVRGRQVVATLEPLLEAHHPSAPSLIRLEPTGEEGRGAFAELRWESTTRDTGVPIGYTLLLILEQTASGWWITELRVMP